MSELIAWGDESVQTQGGVIPTYYMGACICGLGERDIRSQLLSATKRKVSKLHWRDMTLSEKRRSIPVIEALSPMERLVNSWVSVRTQIHTSHRGIVTAPYRHSRYALGWHGHLRTRPT
nr:hypothetical protein [Bifidobacterium catenulatum]